MGFPGGGVQPGTQLERSLEILKRPRDLWDRDDPFCLAVGSTALV